MMAGVGETSFAREMMGWATRCFSAAKHRSFHHTPLAAEKELSWSVIRIVLSLLP
jgi:hypothetical protein